MILRGGTPPRQMQFRQTRTVARPSISEVIHQLLVAPSLPFPRSRFSRGRLKTTSDFGTGSFIQRRMMLRVGGSWNIFGMSFLARNRYSKDQPVLCGFMALTETLNQLPRRGFLLLLCLWPMLSYRCLKSRHPHMLPAYIGGGESYGKIKLVHSATASCFKEQSRSAPGMLRSQERMMSGKCVSQAPVLRLTSHLTMHATAFPSIDSTTQATRLRGALS